MSTPGTSVESGFQSFAVQSLIEEHVSRRPDSPAVELGDQRLTYRELDRASNAFARALQAAGRVPGDRVGLCFRPSPQAIAGMLGALKAAVAYVPLDPDAPAERCIAVIRSARVRQVFTTRDLADRIRLWGAEPLIVDSASDAGAAPVTALRHGELPAYVVYTSGSTGEPKGVEVPHRALSNLARAVAAACGQGPQDRVHQFTPLQFDAAAEAIFAPLSVGATVVMRGAAAPTSAEFTAEVEARRLTILTLPPAFLAEWLADLERKRQKVPSTVRMVIMGGDKIPTRLWDTWKALAPAGARWVNDYGPTEATVTASAHHYAGEPLSEVSLPIGRALPNVTLHLLDANLSPVRRGEAGELYIAGAGLAHGYVGAAAMTAERFVPNPFGPPGARMYRTGDFARELADGSLYYLGREDNQVKIRGYRVELDEVELRLKDVPGVRDAAVIAAGAGAEKRLIGYFAGAVEPEAIRASLKSSLPEYMLPSVLVPLTALPLTGNGKVDKKALPPPPAAPVVAAPSGDSDIATRLSAIWCELLAVPEVKLEDDFFGLGGHSLLAMQLASRIEEEFGAQLPMTSLFEQSTLALQAALLQESVPGGAHP